MAQFEENHTLMANIKAEPELDLYDVENSEEIQSYDYCVDNQMIGEESIVEDAKLCPNVIETRIKTEFLEDKWNSPIKDKFTCSECSKTLTTKCNLNKHMNKMHRREFRNCEVCNWSRKCTKAEYNLHLRREHPKLPNKEFRPKVEDFNGVNFPCIFCEAQKVFQSFSGLKSHLKGVHSRKFACKNCPKAYTRNVHLKRHFKLAHEKNFIDKKDENFEDKASIPMVRIDSVVETKDQKKKKNDTIFICDICAASFKKKCSLLYHFDLHLEIRHTCEECSISFAYAHILNKHMRNFHQRAKLYSCEACNWIQTCTKAEYHSHIRREHPEVAINGFRPVVENFNGVDYPCIYCEPKALFGSFEMLKGHLSSVHERRHACTICPCARKYSSALVWHLQRRHNI